MLQPRRCNPPRSPPPAPAPRRSAWRRWGSSRWRQTAPTSGRAWRRRCSAPASSWATPTSPGPGCVCCWLSKGLEGASVGGQWLHMCWQPQAGPTAGRLAAGCGRGRLADARPCSTHRPPCHTPLPPPPQVALALGGACGVMAALLYRSWGEQARLAALVAKREAELAKLVSTPVLRSCCAPLLPYPCLPTCFPPAAAGPPLLLQELCRRAPTPPSPPPAPPPPQPAPTPQLMKVMELQRSITAHRSVPLIRHVSMPLSNGTSAAWPAVIVV